MSGGPQINVRLSSSEPEIRSLFSKLTKREIEFLVDFWKKKNFKIDFGFVWENDPSGPSCAYSLDKPELENLIKKETEKFKKSDADLASIGDATSDALDPVADAPESERSAAIKINYDEVVDAIFDATPTIEYFRSRNSLLLPNEIALDDQGNPEGNGSVAALNFLSVAQIDANLLCSTTDFSRENMLSRANLNITNDFNAFWSQLIGGDVKIGIECKLTEKFEGGQKKFYLTFWTREGVNRLFPTQRSEGVRWFLSFYLHIRAAAIRKRDLVFLLDEPGASLHAKAQSDALRLINQLSKTVRFVYSTHSPTMIEFEKFSRLLVVQRDPASEHNPTIVIPAHNLSAASKESLSPILSAMGADFSSQNVIKKTRNVILEEISAFYYLSSLWTVQFPNEEAYFIPANGRDNIPELARMFLGWGLQFVIVLDDEPDSRRLIRDMKRDFCGDDETRAAQLIRKIKGCHGIEDMFSKSDFATRVVGCDPIPDGLSNSSFAKERRLNKAVLGFKFAQSIRDKKFSWSDLDEETRTKFSSLFADISQMLKNHDQ